MATAPLRIGFLGFGVVGTGTYRMLVDNRESISRKVGAPLDVAKIGIRDPQKPREAPDALFTTDLEGIVDDPDIDMIIEVMGGVEPAGSLIERALRNGKHVVTANKELIAKRGGPLIRLAAANSLDLHFEAAVGGGIPLIQPLKHQLAGNDVLKLMGIVNGTTNYILTRMTEQRMSLEDALGEAQRLGYAEADPTADVDGHDAQCKLAILSGIAFGRETPVDCVYREGIRGLTADDIHFAGILGYRIKLLGIAEAIGPAVLARVHPTLLPKKHPLANVHDVYNAVQIRGDFVGDVIFSGRGAGSDPTGSAIVGDLIDVARNIRLGGAGNVIAPETGGQFLTIDSLVSRYYLRMRVDDKPRVLGQIASRLGEFDVSLTDMEMRVLDAAEGTGEIVFLTHECRESDFRQATEALDDTCGVREIATWLRVETREA
jgi:homoserine dehydrogenase